MTCMRGTTSLDSHVLPRAKNVIFSCEVKRIGDEDIPQPLVEEGRIESETYTWFVFVRIVGFHDVFIYTPPKS